MSIVGQFKAQVKKSKLAVKYHGMIAWRLHVLKDWWGTRVWKRTTEVVTPLGFKLTSGFHPAYDMMRAGTFEPEECALIAKLVSKVDLFVDIGANLGYYTCLALHKGRPVVAVEPQPQNLQCLFQNLRANGWEDRAEVFPVALSAKPGLLTLYGASGPSASLIKNWAGYSSQFSRVVPISTLDTLVARRPAQRVFIKIDVEGAEYQVLQGACHVLASVPKPIWLLEVCLQEFHPGGANPDFKKTFELFWGNGYVVYTASQSPKRVTPEEVDAWSRKGYADSGTFNYLFVDATTDLAELLR